MRRRGIGRGGNPGDAGEAGEHHVKRGHHMGLAAAKGGEAEGRKLILQGPQIEFAEGEIGGEIGGGDFKIGAQDGRAPVGEGFFRFGDDALAHGAELFVEQGSAVGHAQSGIGRGSSHPPACSSPAAWRRHVNVL